MAGRHARAILPPVNPDEGHLVGICISKAWIPVIFTALSRLEWRASWQEGTDIDRAEQCILSLYSILRNAQECGVKAMPYKLRQNPTNPCLLEQSNDNGLSWQPAFNYALCKRAPSPLDLDIWISTKGPTIISEYETIINNYTTNNDMSVFAPNIVYQTGQTEANGKRNMALCQATRDLVAYACEAELSNRNNASLIGSVAAAALGIVGALTAAGVILTSAGTGTALAFAIASAATGVAADLLGGLSSEILNNDETRDKVAKCLYCAIKGQTPNETTFSTALGACNFPFGSPAAQLAEAISGIIDQPDIFATWVKYAEAAIPSAELGLINCPFECEDNWIVYDFRDSLHGFNPVPLSDGQPQGVWVSGSGVRLIEFAGKRIANISRTWTQAYTVTQAIIELAWTGTSTGQEAVYFHLNEPSYELNAAPVPHPVDGISMLTWTGSVTVSPGEILALAPLGMPLVDVYISRLSLRVNP